MPKGKRSAEEAGVTAEPSNKKRKLNTSAAKTAKKGSKSKSRSPRKATSNKKSLKRQSPSKKATQTKRKSPRKKVDKAKLKSLRKEGIKRFLARTKQFQPYAAKHDTRKKGERGISFLVKV